MTAKSTMFVGEWNAWSGFLIQQICPDAYVQSIQLGDPAISLLNRVQDSHRVLLFHINLTFLERAMSGREQLRLALVERGVCPLNMRVESIDKWSVQSACARAALPVCRASRLGNPEELLVVKSRANHAGHAECEADPFYRNFLAIEFETEERIRIVRRKDVAAETWDSATLTVERYIANREGRFHRTYVFGDQVAVATSRSDKQLREMWQKDGVDLITCDKASSRPLSAFDPISVTSRLAREMHLEYGALDLMVDDTGLIYPVDVNVTTWWGPDENRDLIEFLRRAAAEFREFPSLCRSTL